MQRDRGVAHRNQGQRVRVLVPQRGHRRDYLALVKKNAEQNLRAFLVHQEATETASATALTELAAALDLPEPPHRIECYDISNIQGRTRSPRWSCSSKAVPRRAITATSTFKPSRVLTISPRCRRRCGGDCATCVKTRTVRRWLRATRPAPRSSPGAQARALPSETDLLLIDGGKGQLSAVVEVMHELDMWGIPVAGLAKEHEWLYLPINRSRSSCRRTRPDCIWSCACATRRTASRSRIIGTSVAKR